MAGGIDSRPSGNYNSYEPLQEDSDAPSYTGTGGEPQARDINQVTMADELSSIPLRDSQSTDNSTPQSTQQEQIGPNAGQLTALATAN